MATIGSVGSAPNLKINKVADETISALKLVRAASGTTIKVGGSGVDFETAQILGVALTAGTLGQNIQILLVGEVVDALFSSFSVNNPLYLASNGSITETKPASGFLTQVGKALGNNAIFITIEQPIALA